MEESIELNEIKIIANATTKKKMIELISYANLVNCLRPNTWESISDSDCIIMVFVCQQGPETWKWWPTTGKVNAWESCLYFWLHFHE